MLDNDRMLSDDDNMKMRSSKTSDHLITKTVSKYLTYGVIIAGWPNSIFLIKEFSKLNCSAVLKF